MLSLKTVSRFIIVITVVGVVTWSYFSLVNPILFPIRKVQVRGSYSHVSTQFLQKLITPYVKASFFGLSATNLQHRLEQIPWIAEASIRRKFPSTIVITLQQQQPILIWNNTSLMNQQGVLFTPDSSTIPKNLPRLIGPDGQQQQVFSMMQQLNQFLTPLQLTVQQLNLSSRGAWVMQVSNGIVVVLGKQNIWARLQQFIEVYPKIIGDRANKVISVDLRYPNGLAVKWSQK